MKPRNDINGPAVARREFLRPHPVRLAWQAGTFVPAFNVPYLPMIEAVVRAAVDTCCVVLVEVARLEWMKFGAKSLRAVSEEYHRCANDRYTRLHLDHVPVIDEDGLRVNHLAILREAIDCGYDSVMVDASRLPLNDNISVTRQAVQLAHAAGIACEAELGAVLGHEAGPLPPYEELYESGRGFTHPDEALRFVTETCVDWLAVAAGNIHGAISGIARAEAKVRARLNIAHLRRLRDVTRVPLVLHGGTGIQKDCLLDAVRNGISKVNIGYALRAAFESAGLADVSAGQEAVYREACKIITEDLELAGSSERILMN